MNQPENSSSSRCLPAAEWAEQNAVVFIRVPGAKPEAAAGDEEEAAGKGANHQGSEGAG